MIRLDQIFKSFRGRRALHDVSLEIAAGEIVGLLGENGAGKSTLLGIPLGLVTPDQGEAFIRGVSVQRNPRRALRGVGAVFEQAGFCGYFSGATNLAMLAGYSGGVTKSEIAEAVRFVGLEERIGDLVRTYSRGMKLRLALAQALLPRPEIVILDEPMEGLDPVGVRDVREIIRRLRAECGATMLLSSHRLAEVEELCDRVAIMRAGRLVFAGRWQDEGDASSLEEFYLRYMSRA